MPEFLINDKGLSRCCLESVSLYTLEKDVRSNAFKNQPKIGEVFSCEVCSEEMELVEEGNNLCWQKKYVV